ncbi:thiamine phosphate synthase [Candidatus Poribacteria bacterium]|nr:MAG: thiamine phosphate synthase [Candidatus Poribacteria bacterium]
MKTQIGVLHVITDTTLQSRFTHAQLAELAITGGADTVQFRQKIGTTRELVQTAQEMQAICAQNGVPLIINDRADIALAVGAKGVHFGQDDMPVAIGRRILPAENIIGASARTEEKILAAISEGADYIGFGPIYGTTSKPDAENAKGLARLRRMCEIARCPVIAIGGITVDTAAEVIGAGAHGIAVISAVCAHPEPQVATAALLSEIQKGQHEPSQ